MIDQRIALQPPRWSVVAALMVAMFAITVGYGVVLPILPFDIERLTGSTDAASISRHTGFLSGIYTLALFLFAPMWGSLSDRIGRRPLILFGLMGFAVTLALFGLTDRLSLLYLIRFLNGFFASAVTPAAYALLGDLSPSRSVRAHRFALLNIAATAGFLIGPLVGGLILKATQTASAGLAIVGLPAPYLATAALALLAAPVVWRLLPEAVQQRRTTQTGEPQRDRAILWRLLTIAMVTASAIGAFEVGLSLRGKAAGLDPSRIGMMFMECSLVMFVAQGIVFSPLVKSESTRWLFVPSLVALAVGLVAVPLVTGYVPLVLAVSLIAASAGTLSPIVTYWISLGTNDKQGAQLGLQTSAASFGQALGSAAGGLLFDVAHAPGASFVVPAAIVLASLAAALGLPRLLLRPLRDSQATEFATTRPFSEDVGAPSRSS